MSLKLIVNIPPSVNKYLFPRIMYRQNGTPYVRMVETREATIFKAQTAAYIRKEIKKQGWKIPDKGVFVDVYIDYFFNRKGTDPNNFLKILFDTFKNAGVYIDDDIAKPQTGLVVIDKYNPRLEIEIKKSKQVGIFKNKKQRKDFIVKYENTDKFKNKLKLLDDNRIIEDLVFDENGTPLLKID